MIHAILPFSPNLSEECIKTICIHFKIKASVLDKRGNSWCLETEDAANFFWLGCNFQNKVEEFYKEKK
jgi:hypothetical protein